MAGLFPQRSRREIPVAHRLGDDQPQPPRRRSGAGLKASLTTGHWVILAAIPLVFMLTVWQPLNNYFEQRAAIERLEAEKATKTAAKEAKIRELERLQSDEYVAELARTRLGVVKPGEVAYRIIDPRQPAPTGPVTPNGTPTENLGPWWEVMWDSIADPGSAPLLPEEKVEHEAPAGEQQPADPNAPVIPGQESPAGSVRIPSPEEQQLPPGQELPPPPPPGEQPPAEPAPAPAPEPAPAPAPAPAPGQ